jgi:type II secretory pathway pseudopilin PulG
MLIRFIIKTKEYLDSENNHKFLSGFTMIETLVAVTILLVSIVGPITLAQQSLSSSSFAKDQVTAFYLAQESMEYVRNVRDTNSFQGSGWLDNLTDDGNECDNGCKIDGRLNFDNFDAIQSCSDDSCRVMVKNGIYGHETGGDWENSIFSRKITIEEKILDQEAIVTVEINWKQHTSEKEVKIKENLFKWR